MRCIATIAFGAFFFSLIGWAARSSSSGAGIPTGPDAQRLKIGEFQYQDVHQGKNVGTSTITIRKLRHSTNYGFSAVATFPRSAGFKGFESQRWECVTTSALKPISAMLTFGQGSEMPPIFDIKYVPGRVTGFALNRKDPNAGSTRPINAALPANTFDQRLDWATILASDLQTERHFEFNVYDPGTAVSHVVVQVGPSEALHVPAGIFAVYRVLYRIEKSSGTEQYEMWPSRSIPRTLVQERFPNGVVGQLIAWGGDKSH